MLGGYVLYLLVWAVAAVLVSSALPRARDALLALVAGWIVTVILLPRVMPDFAAGVVERPSRIETEVGESAAMTAAAEDADADAQAQEQAERAIHADPAVQAVLKEFSGATIVPGSIRPVKKGSSS